MTIRLSDTTMELLNDAAYLVENLAKDTNNLQSIERAITFFTMLSLCLKLEIMRAQQIPDVKEPTE